MRRALPAAAAACLALAAPAAAHVTVRPPFVEAGTETTLAFETPNERAPRATVAITTTAPPGVEIVSAEAPAGWRAAVAGSTVSWRGGRITGARTVPFPVRIVARVRAGTYRFSSEQRYSDGAVVRWQVDVTVLPAQGAAAPKQHPWGAVLAGVIGLAVIVASLAGLRLVRRRPLQDR